MPRHSVQDGVDPIDAAVELAIANANDNFEFGSDANETLEDDPIVTEGDDHAQQAQATTQDANISEQQNTGDATLFDGQQVNNQDTANQPQQQTQEQATPNTPEPANGRSFGQAVKDDGQGNFVDATSGQIVARRGAERRMYEKARGMENTLVNTQQELVRMQKANQELSQRSNAPVEEHAAVAKAKQSNLTDQDMSLGMDIVARMKTDPVGGVQWVLQTALAQGYTIEQVLGAQADGTVNNNLQMGAVKQMIDNSVAPLINQQTQTQNATAEQQRVQREYNTFVNTHEFAETHMDAIVALKKQNPTLSPQAAYYEVKMYAVQNGYDFTQPLEPQVQARRAQAQQPQQQQQQQQQQPTTVKPLPANGVNTNIVTQQQTIQPDGDDWDSIVRAAINENRR